MSVTVDWMDSRYSVIYANFVDHWDWGDVQNALAKSHTLMTKSSRSVTLMLDFVGSVKATKTDSLIALAPPIATPNLVRIVIISDDRQLSSKMENAMRRFFPDTKEIESAISQEEAFSMVRQTLEVPAIKL